MGWTGGVRRPLPVGSAGTAVAFADSVHAVLADGRDPAGPSLSPSSMHALAHGASVVLPSPNGSTCAIAASEAGTAVLAGCLRNAAAVGAWADKADGPVTVIACGETWPDGSLRPALEDLLGAGAILAAMTVPVLTDGAFRASQRRTTRQR